MLWEWFCKTLSDCDSVKREMEVNARFQNHARVLALSESVPQAQARDLGVTDTAAKLFINFVKQVGASARMAKMKHTPESTAQREVRWSSRVQRQADGSMGPPKAAAVAAPEIQPPATVIDSLIQLSFVSKLQLHTQLHSTIACYCCTARFVDFASSVRGLASARP